MDGMRWEKLTEVSGDKRWGQLTVSEERGGDVQLKEEKWRG